jgi:hypothetical protein
MVHHHCPGEAFIYCILHDVAGVWRLLNDAVSSSDSTVSINKLKNLCKRPLPNLWHHSYIFFAGREKPRRKKFSALKKTLGQELQLRLPNTKESTSPSTAYLTVECFHLGVHIHTHTYIRSSLTQPSSIDRWMWDMSDIVGCSTQLGQKNILNKSIYKIYVGETLK